MEAEAFSRGSIIVDILIAVWGALLLGIGFIIIQHLPEHSQQLNRICATLDAINKKLDRG